MGNTVLDTLPPYIYYKLLVVGIVVYSIPSKFQQDTIFKSSYDILISRKFMWRHPLGFYLLRTQGLTTATAGME